MSERIRVRTRRDRMMDNNVDAPDSMDDDDDDYGKQVSMMDDDDSSWTMTRMMLELIVNHSLRSFDALIIPNDFDTPLHNYITFV